jgi:hypothetical protein
LPRRARRATDRASGDGGEGSVGRAKREARARGD